MSEHAYYDIAVVGAGLAGVCAAISAAAFPKTRVLLLESASKPLPYTKTLPFYDGAINAVDPAAQGRQGIFDSPELFMQQTLERSGYRASPELVRELCYRSYDAKIWLRNLGAEFMLKTVQLPGSGFPRGAYFRDLSQFRECLLKALLAGGVDCVCSASVKQMEQKDEGWKLTYAESSGAIREVRTLSVIACSGGFVSDDRICSFHDPRNKGLRSIDPTHGRSADFLKALVRNGAGCVGMDFLDYLTVLNDSVPTQLRLPTQASVLVSRDGRLLATGLDSVERTEALLSSPDYTAYALFPSSMTENLPKAQAQAIWRVFSIGEAVCVHRGESVQEGSFSFVSEQFWRTLTADLSAYADRATRMNERQTPALSQWIGSEKLMLVKVTLVKQRTLGGVRIDPHAQILNALGSPIKGLFAAGEAVGGVHGKSCLPGNSELAAVVFGRTAAESASHYLLSLKKLKDF